MREDQSQFINLIQLRGKKTLYVEGIWKWDPALTPLHELLNLSKSQFSHMWIKSTALPISLGFYEEQAV